MKIIIDVMGGDNAPEAGVIGVLDAAAAMPEHSYIIVGRENEIRDTARAAGRETELDGIRIVHADGVITMEDQPLSVVREKSDSSMAVGLRMLRDGEGDALVSSGNTGALHAGSSLVVRRIRGVKRSAIASVLPFARPMLLIDSGANIDVQPEYLRQFAVMGSIYMKNVFGIESPQVGLLNNGTEECKGGAMMVDTYKLLRGEPTINFVGNVEAKAAPLGACDVLVTDGFTGNVFLKLSEGLGQYLLSCLKDCFTENLVTKASALAMRGSLRRLRHSVDASEFGGAPLLGLSKPVLKTHGSSDARAFVSTIKRAADFAGTGVHVEIAKCVEQDAARAKAAAESEEAAKAAEAAASTPEKTDAAESAAASEPTDTKNAESAADGTDVHSGT